MASSSRVPVQLTAFVGRATELDDLAALRTRARLVTIVGVGGAGKTRLAVEHVAVAGGPEATFVDLAAVTDPAEVVPAVAHALALRDNAGAETIDAVVEGIDDREHLVVLDNCEHVVDDAAAAVDAILRGCPSVAIIATSREPLRVAGEVTYHLGPLNPADAERLFCERARLARPDVDLGAANAPHVEQICRLMDGIPLALELVAARVRALSFEQLAIELRERTSIGVGERLSSARQQTLDGSIEWSHDLLSAAERSAFMRLSVFSGTFDVAAAEAVAAEPGDGAGSVLELLVSLVDKSLVVRTEVGSITRYRLLDTIRRYARGKLAGAGEEEVVHRRLAAHCCLLASAAAAGETDAALLLEVEHDNLRTAFEWSLERGDATTALLLPTALGPAWLRHGWLGEGLRWLRTALALEGDVDPAIRARALALAAIWGGNYGDNPLALDQGDEAVAIARGLGDVDALMAALSGAARARYQVDPYGAIPYDTELLEVARAAGDEHHAALATGGIGIALIIAGDPKSGLPYLTEAEAALRDTPHAADWLQAAAALAVALTGVARVREADGIVRSTLPFSTPGEPGRWLTLYAGACLAAATRELDDARQWAAELIEMGERLGLTQPTALGRYASGLASMAEGDASAARADFEIAGAVGRNSVAAMWAAIEGPFNVPALSVLSEAALLSGDDGAARATADAALQIAGAYKSHRAQALVALGRVAHARGEARAASSAIQEAIDIRHDLGDLVGLADAFELAAALIVGLNADDAVRLLATADRLRSDVGVHRFAVFDSLVDEVRGAATASLGDDGFARGWARGAALPVDDAVAIARRRRRTRSPVGWDSLTRAELEVARLIGEGLPNKEIAVRLHISARTVQSHLSHVYAKLHVRSRLELARELAAQTPLSE